MNSAQPQFPLPTELRPPEETAALLPDLNYIRRIPILEVARSLGINHSLRGATWTSARCWRPENHKNGDRTPSLNFQTKKNKFMCSVCDKRLHSNLDLVMSFLGCKLPEAMKWFDHKYPGIPRTRIKKVHLDFRVGVGRAGVDGIESDHDLVRAGLLRLITKPNTRAVAWVLASFRDANHFAEVSYATLMYLTRIRSEHTISRALRELEAFHVFKRHLRRSRKRAGGCDTTQYEFTFYDPELIAMLQRQRE